MKKMMFLFTAGLILSSCGGPDAEAVDNAAEAMCECVEKRRAESDPDNFLDTDDIHFSFCALDVAINHRVDCASDEFGAALANKCADLVELQKEYAKQ